MTGPLCLCVQVMHELMHELSTQALCHLPVQLLSTCPASFPCGNNHRKLLLIPPTQPLIQHIAYAVSSLFLAFSYAFLHTQMLSPLQGFNQTPYSIP